MRLFRQNTRDHKHTELYLNEHSDEHLQHLQHKDVRLSNEDTFILPARRLELAQRNGNGSHPATERDGRSEANAAAQPRLQARFWGVRGSHPAALPTGSRFGGNTTCLEIRYGRHVIIIDAGSGIIALGDELVREMRDWPIIATRPTVSLLFTHAHHDHLCGMPFFAPLYRPEAQLNFLGPDLAGMRFEEIIAGYMRSPYFPIDFRDLPSQRRLTSIGNDTRLVWIAEADAPIVWDSTTPPPQGALLVEVLHSSLHPREGTLVYRLTAGEQSLVFATDIEIVEIEEQGGDTEQRYLRFISGANVLVHDAQYSEDDYAGIENAPTRGYGHSTPVMAARVARKAGVRQLILFHHDPGYADADITALEQAARQIFPATVAAREGAEISLDVPWTWQI